MSSTIVSNAVKTVITSFSCSGNLLNTNSVKWSESNSIAIIINRGIYVFESHLNPNEWTQQFPYHKTIIDNPKETMSFDCGIFVTELLSSSGLNEQNLLMCDQTLITDTANANNFRSYRSVEWSPLSRQYGCLLGSLTLDHRLVIHRKVRTGWEPTIDLSVLLNERMKESWNSLNSSNYSIYKQRIYSLATVAFCWAHKWVQNDDKSGESCVLYMGSKNGLITMWTITIDPQISAQLLYKWTTNLDQINSLKCFDEFIIISAFNGLVSVIHSGFCFDDSPNPLNLWSEEDKIGVFHLSAKRIDKNTFEVIFTKSVFVIICRVRTEKKDDSITMILKCCKSILGLHQMPSTGLCASIDSKYLMTSMDGRLIEIEVLNDLTLNQSEVTLDSVSSSAMCAFGIDCSPNASLCALVQSLSLYHDHLLIKEPIQIIIFSNVSFDSLTHILKDKYLNQTSIAKNTAITECFDYLDCVRAFLPINQYSSHDSLLFTLINNQNLINCNNLFKLRLIRFITRAFITNSKFSETTLSLLKTRAELCEDLILKLFIENLYHSIVSDSEKFSNLTFNQISSLKNMNSWLSQRFDQQLMDENKFKFESIAELCPICEQEIKFSNKNSGICSKSHHFLRCTNSLLLCDFVNYKSEKCIRCLSCIVIKPPVWKQLSVCLYCD